MTGAEDAGPMGRAPQAHAGARAAASDTEKGLFRQVMGRFATGVTVVTTVVAGRTFGMTANAFMAGSLEPPLCLVSVNRSAAMHGRLAAARRFGVSVLAEAQRHLSNHFAGRRLADAEPDFVEHAGMPVLRHAVGVIVADVVDTYACGDHTLFVGSIRVMVVTSSAPPLVFHGGRYARLERGSLGEEVALASFW